MVRRKISRKSPLYLKISLWAVFLGITVFLVLAFRLYNTIFKPVMDKVDKDSIVLFVEEGTSLDDLVVMLEDQGIVEDSKAFRWLAERKNLKNKINPGRYRINPEMNNNDLVNMIRSGNQEPVMLIFNNVRTLNDLAREVSDFLAADSSSIAAYLTDSATPSKYGFTMESFPAMFIPNSYEFYWTATPEEFAERMKREYVAFWSGTRHKQADRIGLSLVEVSTLASIVEMESLHPDENSRIAGVFMNRIEKGIPLQSDPTIIYALGDFSIKRVLNKDKVVDSPYNTYKNRGLPPGPICIPSIEAIDGVLEYESHNFLYFCAKPDFSGYHNFARTLSQHNKNSRLWQQALNRRKIYR